MLNRKLLAIAGAAFLAFAGVAPAMAQSPLSSPSQSQSGASGRAPSTTSTEREATSNADNAGGRTRAVRNRRQQAAPTPPNPEEIRVKAQEQATAAGISCRVTEATALGVNAEQQALYEAACATGPGYILIAATPPTAVDCVILAGQADLDRARDPAANVGIQCAIPGNKDVLKVVSAYATEAGAVCAIDQGASIGKSSANNYVYEVGCNGTDGYWLEKAPTGWIVTRCIVVITQAGKCQFSTPVEQAALVKTWLASSDAAACDVTEARYMGANANGSFYEAKCGSGDGYIARFDTAMAVQQVYPCAGAARIGGGCKLTTVAPAADAPPAETPATATPQ